MGEEAVGIACRALVELFDSVDACFVEHALGRRPQVEVAAAHDVRSEARAVRSEDVLADLVTAWANPRTDDRRQPASERRGACLNDPVKQSEPSCVEKGQPRAA